nr:lytic murein transglycosylase [Natronospira proteinivora]
METEEFQACLAGIESQARSEGVSQNILSENLRTARWQERVIELDRRQPEFTTPFHEYLNRRVTDDRVEQGRRLLAEHRPLLEEIAEQYGVPPQYLVAFWGLETNYGSFFGNMRVIDSLATLACDQRRSAYFTTELIAALRILDNEAMGAEEMEGSWAGAMGHVQFMPSIFLQYAVDYDGSGQRDLWGSVPDAMASAANFLHGIGWEHGYRWGREVVLPDDFDFSLAGGDDRLSLEEWRRMGVRMTNGDRLPAVDIEARLLLPAGHRGPAFLVYDNFDVIMRWNRSEYYALAVGHLANRIAGSAGLHNPPPTDTPRLDREQVKTLQEGLQSAGHDPGPVDGILGPATRRAIRDFQRDADKVPDGFPHPDVLEAFDVGESS